jgi:hypothetical protein
VITSSSTDSLLNSGFHLAHFIVGDREIALRVLTGALAKIQVAVTTQGKRLYYTPTGRSWARREKSHSRNNISFNELHLLQRLIYLESEPYEIAVEQGKGSKSVSEEDLVIHFVKHLAKKTVKRNSFYVTLGLSRLLHSYTTAETMEIYNAVIQDPERVKDDYYYRSRKGVLMQELKQRFGDLINVSRGPRGEERFEADNNQQRFVGLVRECLSLFTPWQTPCLVPAGIDPITDGIPSLSTIGEVDENTVEVNRMHAVLHPDCFDQLTSNLHLDSPETRLEIPRFFLANDVNHNGSNGNRRTPEKLDEEELRSIEAELDGNAVRRKAARSGILRILVDGFERTRLDLSEGASLRLNVDNDAELIEVRALQEDGEVLLATYLVPANTPDQGHTSIVVEGGQKISVSTSHDVNTSGINVEITYRETNPVRAAQLLLQQFSRALRNRLTLGERWILVSGMALLLVAISIGLIVRYLPEKKNLVSDGAAGQQNSKTSNDLAPSNNTGASPNAESIKPVSPDIANKRLTKSEEKANGNETAARNPTPGSPNTATAPESAGETNTRDLTSTSKGLRLSAVRSVYVEVVGDERSARKIRELLAGNLAASNRLNLTHNRNEADALLSVTILKSDVSEPELATTVELINERGEVIWGNGKKRYRGDPANVTANIARDLLSTIERSARGQ